MDRRKESHYDGHGRLVLAAEWNSCLACEKTADETGREFEACTREPNWITPSWTRSHDQDRKAIPNGMPVPARILMPPEPF